MREPTIARNYAEALFLAAGKRKQAERYGALLDAVAGAVAADPRLQLALESPRVHKATKQQILSRALRGVAPPEFVRFLHAVVRRGRQGILRAIAEQYQQLVDTAMNRVHAGVTLARAADGRLERQIAERLTAALGKTVIPHVRLDPAIVGGMVIRVGDRIFDGSIRRRLLALRYRLLTGGGGQP